MFNPDTPIHGRPNFHGLEHESAEEFLSRGGKIQYIPYHGPRRKVQWTEITAVGQSGRKPSSESWEDPENFGNR